MREQRRPIASAGDCANDRASENGLADRVRGAVSADGIEAHRDCAARQPSVRAKRRQDSRTSGELPRAAREKTQPRSDRPALFQKGLRGSSHREKPCRFRRVRNEKQPPAFEGLYPARREIGAILEHNLGGRGALGTKTPFDRNRRRGSRRIDGEVGGAACVPGKTALEVFEQEILRNHYRGVRKRNRVRRIAPQDTTLLNAGETEEERRPRKHIPDQRDRCIAQHDSGYAWPVQPFDRNPKAGVIQKMRTAVSRDAIAANGDTYVSRANWIVTFQDIL